MSIETVLATIDEEIAKLQHARELLAGSPDVLPTMKRRGRPAGSKNAKPVTGKRRGRPAGSKNKLAIMPKSGKGKRTLTPEGKARIAAAQKARWAAAKGEAEETKVAGKKSAKKAVSEAA